MELYIDSSDVKEIKNLMELVTVSGVTTNPTILTRSGKEPEEVLKEIIDLLDEDMKLFAQVIA
ncbi:MAG: fructose-6-phosphate aldolase, partial [Erysipelotrichaceae bacterium]|nr:fructose-6-phosphate aldolase [Erysipelotrichaceae bacterium]